MKRKSCIFCTFLFLLLLLCTGSAESTSFPAFIQKSRLGQHAAVLSFNNNTNSDSTKITITVAEESCAGICGRAFNGTLVFKNSADAHLSAPGVLNPDGSYSAGGSWQLKLLQGESAVELLYSPNRNGQSYENDLLFIYLLDANNEVLEVRYLIYTQQEDGTHLLYEMQL